MKDFTHSTTNELSHIGIAVKDLDLALSFYVDRLGLHIITTETILTEGVKIVLLQHGTMQIELLQALNESSPIYTYIEKYGEGIHHIAFTVNDISSQLTSLHQQGIQLIDDHPRFGARNTKVAFIHPASSNGVLVELCEKGEANGYV
ncbi:methylmalonyl-CoA epimerase [Virgibacillus salexigens]|uniref:Methylmalonyl-CoA epimerase n=1 Tax=Virgibacillus kapii TaxID=1638645 RepID=A0ABQ2D5R1_9BACI|nr:MULTISPECIES: methylmalonyl-CoA epimerase [Virgibacillus]MYL41894.1 methylmalonyl-CoA epimerase [Virgibacillus massiliensis]GGJ47172.1 methylmalonyl-CoA epimerase [Virgibacillus kapii]